VDELKEKPTTLFLEAMTSCHSMIYIEKNLVGDPLDMRMFEHTKWTITEPESTEEKYGNLSVIAYVKPPSESTAQEDNSYQI
jgi:cation-transporting ATPase 13A2